MLRLLRLALMPASSGNADTSTPIRVMSANPSRRPPASNVRPVATKARPRVVSTPRIRGVWATVWVPVLVTVLDLPSSACRSAHGGRNGDSLDDLVDDIGAGAPGHLGLAGCDHAVGQDGLSQRLNIVGKDVVASHEGGIRPGGAKEMQAGAWGSAQAQGSRGACCSGEVDDVLLDGWAGVQRAYDLDELGDGLAVGHRCHLQERECGTVPVENRDLGCRGRIAHRDAGHEAVALGLG